MVHYLQYLRLPARFRVVDIVNDMLNTASYNSLSFYNKLTGRVPFVGSWSYQFPQMKEKQNKVLPLMPSALHYYDFETGLSLFKQSPTAFDYHPVKIAAPDLVTAKRIFLETFDVLEQNVLRAHEFQIKSRKGITVVQFQATNVFDIQSVK
jgi:hypothetical protein